MNNPFSPFGPNSPFDSLTRAALENLVSNYIKQPLPVLTPASGPEPQKAPQIYVCGAVGGSSSTVFLTLQEDREHIVLEVSNDYRDAAANLTPKMVRELHGLLQRIMEHPAFEVLALKEAVKDG